MYKSRGVLFLKLVKTNIVDLQEGLVLGQDLYVENRLLMKKGSVITARIITLLKNRHVHDVYIQTRIVETDLQAEQDGLLGVKLHENTIVNSETENSLFLQALGELSTEIRYGHVLKNMDDILFIRNLFQRYMENGHYRKLLNTLKDYDTYTYMHAIDVFTLCTLFAKKEGIQNLEHCALGFLFHDIGKLKIPLAILKKEGRLSPIELEVMQKHTQFGYDLLCDLGLVSIAYLAKSHHERIDGSGYPDGLEESDIPREVFILQLIDIYSALTLNRPYKREVGAAEAMAIIYKEKHLLDEKLLARFVDFIGIYPKNSIVLLSDGSHALVDNVNNMYPLLPIVRRLDTNTVFRLPFDFQLKVVKLITYYVETPEKLFQKFSEYLINGEINLMEKYYRQLMDQYTFAECFTKIYIPIYQIFEVIEQQLVMEDVRLKVVRLTFKELLNNMLLQLRSETRKNDAILFIVDQDLRTNIFIQLLEGLFYAKEINPFLLDISTSKEELLNIADYCEASAICVFSNECLDLHGTTRKLDQYHIPPEKLESFVFSFAGASHKEVNLKDKLQKYKAVTKLIAT